MDVVHHSALFLVEQSFLTTPTSTNLPLRRRGGLLYRSLYEINLGLVLALCFLHNRKIAGLALPPDSVPSTKCGLRSGRYPDLWMYVHFISVTMVDPIHLVAILLNLVFKRKWGISMRQSTYNEMIHLGPLERDVRVAEQRR
ncbi:uncharacterized protein BT62DRAFT_1012133 [Guyanagaster necrorhizus]|uniref:Uncharacterized protein n=1 Tax=Guyanagaster necrorhizus TaxID=856835 RepID=A0A9P7VIC9_9AGAR|nr:uncharacterized protein BT62DRAFT_1012133 [Guyanagaster necrorhizus MCA 3950]KAG7440910.1 hypothetical protein BT62DRAFT_1012133 [Guyanagaster necrorhizus MCA 3950]